MESSCHSLTTKRSEGNGQVGNLIISEQAQGAKAPFTQGAKRKHPGPSRDVFKRAVLFIIAGVLEGLLCQELLPASPLRHLAVLVLLVRHRHPFDHRP